MSLIVNNIVTSNSNINYSYLAGEEIFGYVVDFTYSIKTQDISFANGDGVLLTGRAAIRQAYKKKNITARIAGDEILNGLITQISFPESSLTGEDLVTVSIQERRRLDDYSSKSFSKYIPSPHLLEDFSEDYSFSRSGSEYTYKRNISIKYAQDAGDEFLTNAKVFLTNYYFSKRPNIGYYEDGISENARFDQGYNGTLTENIDLVNLSVTLEENFKSSFLFDSEEVSKDIKTSSSIDNKGYLNKTISVGFTSLGYDSQNILETAIANTIDEIISEEESDFGKPFSIQKGINKDSNAAEITLQFSTDPKLTKENSIVYNCSKTKAGAFFEYSLTVEYKSRGANIQERYDNTIALWDSSKDKNESKVSALFPEATSIYEKSRSVNIKKTEGTVSESIVFTIDDIYDSSGLPDGIIKFGIDVSKQEKIKRNSIVLDLMNLQQKLVTSNLDRLGSATVTAKAASDQSYGIFHAKDFLNSKTSEMNDALEEGTYYATADATQIDLSNGTASRVITYIIA